MKLVNLITLCPVDEEPDTKPKPVTPPPTADSTNNEK